METCFTSISLGQECEICHQDAPEPLESCHQCFGIPKGLQPPAPLTEIAEPLHLSTRAHQACFVKDHLVHQQNHLPPSPKYPRRDLTKRSRAASNYSRMKDMIQGKLHSIPRFIVNPLYKYKHAEWTAKDQDTPDGATGCRPHSPDGTAEPPGTQSGVSFSGQINDRRDDSSLAGVQQLAVRHGEADSIGPAMGRAYTRHTAFSPGVVKMKPSHCQEKSLADRSSWADGPAQCASKGNSNTAPRKALNCEKGRRVSPDSDHHPVQEDEAKDIVLTQTSSSHPWDTADLDTGRSIQTCQFQDQPSAQIGGSSVVAIGDALESSRDVKHPAVDETNDQVGSWDHADPDIPDQMVDSHSVVTATAVDPDSVVDSHARTRGSEIQDHVEDSGSVVTPTAVHPDSNTRTECSETQDSADDPDAAIYSPTRIADPETWVLIEKVDDSHYTVTQSTDVETTFLQTDTTSTRTRKTDGDTTCVQQCDNSDNTSNNQDLVSRNRGINSDKQCCDLVIGVDDGQKTPEPERRSSYIISRSGTLLELTDAMKYTRGKLLHRCCEDLNVLLENSSKQIQAVSEELVHLLQERHDLQEQVEMRKIAIEQLLRLQTETSGVSELGIQMSIILPAQVDTKR